MQLICIFYASVCGLSLQFTFLCFVKLLASEVFMQSICLFYAGPRWNIRCAPDEVAVMMSKLTEEQKCVFVHDYHLSNLLDIKLTSSGPPSLIKRLYCNRAIQFIRAQVLKPLPRQLVCCTWAHINPVVREITRDFNLSTTYSQDRTWFSNHTSHVT